MPLPKYLWRPTRTQAIDECFGALGRALYLAQRYEFEAREAALMQRWEALIAAFRTGDETHELCALNLRNRALGQAVNDLIAGDCSDSKPFLLEAKIARNFLAHQAASEIAEIAKARPKKTWLRRRKRYFAKLERCVMLLWLAYDHVAWFNEALGSLDIPVTPSLDAQWIAVREWISSDFASVRDADRMHVAGFLAAYAAKTAPNQRLQPTKARRRPGNTAGEEPAPSRLKRKR